MNKKTWLLGGASLVFLVGALLAIFVFEVHTAFIDERVDEELVVSDGMVLVASGELHEVVHQGKGKVEIYEDGGSCFVRLSDFDIENGPDLHLRLIDIEDAKDSEAVKSAKFVDLGPLKGNIGNQSYALTEAFDEKKHRALVVWCERFGVNFLTAPLRPQTL